MLEKDWLQLMFSHVANQSRTYICADVQRSQDAHGFTNSSNVLPRAATCLETSTSFWQLCKLQLVCLQYDHEVVPNCEVDLRISWLPCSTRRSLISYALEYIPLFLMLWKAGLLHLMIFKADLWVTSRLRWFSNAFEVLTPFPRCPFPFEDLTPSSRQVLAWPPASPFQMPHGDKPTRMAPIGILETNLALRQ